MSQKPFCAKGKTFALVGNPNSGKTTIFNAVTGTDQLVGNWSGVTVQAKLGTFRFGHQECHLIDLPGIYSLITHQDASQDEKAAWEFLRQEQYDAIMCVVDAHHLERSLYLALQCLELGKPVIIVLNRIDLAEKKGLTICPLKLSQLLQSPVVPICARRNAGLGALLQQTLNLAKQPPRTHYDYYPQIINDAWHKLQASQSDFSMHELIQCIESECTPHSSIIELKKQLSGQTQQDLDVYMAQCRYQCIDEMVHHACSKNTSAPSQGLFSMTAWLDKWACHRIIGVPIFFAVMYSLFFFAINVGGVFQSAVEVLSEGILVDGLASLLINLHLPDWLVVTLTQGAGKGFSTVLTFVPVLAAMFFALALLQDSGYMSRAAFVIDRVMRSIGLPGKSFVPMIVGFGCNVPAILGTRALDHKRERILTVMMSPFMSCGARLAIFTVFVATFFPQGGENIIFLLYTIGISMAVLTGLLLKKTLLKGAPTPFLMDMPDYQVPHLPSLCKQAYLKSKKFVKDALKLVVPICMLLACLNQVSFNHNTSSLDAEPVTALEQLGKTVTPLFSPMGITEDNWPATVGLFTGVMAKEVVIGSLNTLYQPQAALAEETTFSMSSLLTSTMVELEEGFIKLGQAFYNPIKSKAPDTELADGVSGVMLQKFVTPTAAFAYLIFVLLYVPCVSVISAMYREVSLRWTLFSGFWTTLLAYSSSVIYFQLATITYHPVQSLLWTICLAAVNIGFIYTITVYSRARLTHIPVRIRVQTS